LGKFAINNIAKVTLTPLMTVLLLNRQLFLQSDFSTNTKLLLKLMCDKNLMVYACIIIMLLTVLCYFSEKELGSVFLSFGFRL